ncbi:MAG: hypothetical protein EOP06_01785 [Proteobacteria bacterium]|nr:MAG: hypothetical protein EOP06_01785 [Pseudomonadota bacterium]
MKKTTTALVLLSFVTAFAMFTNCSAVNFDASPEAIAKQEELFTSNSSVLLNEGAEFSNQPKLFATLKSPRASEMKLSVSADCSDGEFEPYVSLKLLDVKKSNGLNQVFAQFKDISGVVSGCVSDEIVHDDQPPIAAYTSSQGRITNLERLQITWTASDAVSGIDSTVCSDNVNQPQDCDRKLDVTNKLEGANRVSIRVKDRAGNSTGDLTYNWVFDKSPPTVIVNSQPALITGSANGSITFSGTDVISRVASYSCSMDGLPSADCESPLALNNLSSGVHRFEVIAFDEAGNRSQPASASWTVDLSAPTLTFTQTPPALTNSTTAVFAYTALDDGKLINDFRCKLDNAAQFVPCTSPRSLTGLASGRHSFHVFALDSVRNASSPISYSWTVDTVAPVVVITKSPPSLTNLTKGDLAWTVSDDSNSVKSVECLLDSKLIACANLSFGFSNLSEGAHSFVVKATDGAGNTGSATHAWTIDLTPPSVEITSGPSSYENPTTKLKYAKVAESTFSFSGTDQNGIASFECSIDGRLISGCASGKSIGSLTEGGHIYSVRAIDRAGNRSAETTYSWSIDMSPPLITQKSISTLTVGQRAKVSYEVFDQNSGVKVVRCGLISAPTGSISTGLSECSQTAEKDLGVFSTAGAYVFQIQGTDHVGNVSNEIVNINVTTAPLICDPFNMQAEGLCTGGLMGEIYYLTGSALQNFLSISPRTVDYFYTNGARANALLNLPNLNVPVRNFSEGFPTSTGRDLLDSNGQKLNEYFAFRLNTVAKLDPKLDLPGYYQFATISDDGSVVSLSSAVGAPLKRLVENDGDHAVAMECSTTAIFVSDTSRLPMEVKYYQGPRTEIALMLLWKRVANPQSAADPFCGSAGATNFFGPDFKDYSAKYQYGQLLERGWRVMAPSNFIAPLTNQK